MLLLVFKGKATAFLSKTYSVSFLSVFQRVTACKLHLIRCTFKWKSIMQATVVQMPDHHDLVIFFFLTACLVVGWSQPATPLLLPVCTVVSISRFTASPLIPIAFQHCSLCGEPFHFVSFVYLQHLSTCFTAIHSFTIAAGGHICSIVFS